MAIRSLIANQPKSIKQFITESRYRLGYGMNLHVEGADVNVVHQLHVKGIAYNLMGCIHWYLAVLIDLIGRKIGDWYLDVNRELSRVLVARIQIIGARPDPESLHHTDRAGRCMATN